MNFYRKNHKYNAKRTTIDGINFDSLAEAEYYQLLKKDPEIIHVDCHVPFTLHGGLRLNVDFLVWKKTSTEETGRVEAHEVKGYETPDFKRMRKLFDESHPLAPMIVIKKSGKYFKPI